MTRLLYKPFGIVVSALGGMIAAAAFKQVWKLVGGEHDAPEATDPARRWAEVLPAAALQGAVFGLVKAAIDRSGAAGFARLTGSWPARDGTNTG